MRAGFLGLGTMGLPMARNLARKFPLTVWNRSVAKYDALRESGATFDTAETPTQVVERADVIFSMMVDYSVMKSLMDDEFRKAMQGKTLVNTSTFPIEASEEMARVLDEAGGHYVEMPVSGSKKPAEDAQLVGIMAGSKEDTDRIRPMVETMTRAMVYCGPVGQALRTKFAVNLHMITVTASLAEASNMARAQGLDMDAFGQVLGLAPVASPYSKHKMSKIVNEDWSSEGSVWNAIENIETIRGGADNAGAFVPLFNKIEQLYRQTAEMGLGDKDFVSIYKVYNDLKKDGVGKTSSQ